MKKVVLFGFLLLALGSVGNIQAQTHEEGVPYQMELITNQMADQLNDIPANIRRVAVYKMNYNAIYCTGSRIHPWRNRIFFK